MDLEKISAAIDAFKKEKTPENKTKYIEELDALLKEEGVTEENISIIIEGDFIDEYSTFYDFIETLNNKKCTAVISFLKKSEYIKTNKTKSVYKMLFGLLYIMTIDIKKYNKQFTRVIDLINQKIKDDGGRFLSGGYTDAYKEMFIDAVLDEKELPLWKQLNISSKALKRFTDNLLAPLDSLDKKKSVEIVSNWLKSGQDIIPILEAKEEKDKTLNRILKADKVELEKILDEYDKESKKKIKEITDLKSEINTLHENLEKKDAVINNLRMEILSSEKRVEVEISKREDAEKEVEERKNLNQTQVHYQEMSINSLKDEIGDALKSEYEDFYETLNVDMSEMLGEIYRDKLLQIAKILEQKDIKVK